MGGSGDSFCALRWRLFVLDQCQRLWKKWERMEERKRTEVLLRWKERGKRRGRGRGKAEGKKSVTYSTRIHSCSGTIEEMCCCAWSQLIFKQTSHTTRDDGCSRLFDTIEQRMSRKSVQAVNRNVCKLHRLILILRSSEALVAAPDE